MKNLSLLFIAFLLFQPTSFAQAPDTMWTKTFGGNSYDEGNVIIETEDKGFVVGGGANTHEFYASDSYVIRLNEFGDTLWTAILAYGSPLNKIGPGLYELDSGDFVMGFYGLAMGWGENGVLRINATGDSVQYLCVNYPSGSGPKLHHMCKTQDNNFVLAYSTIDLPARGHLRKYDSFGNLIWWGVGCHYIINYVIQKNDSGYAFTGYSTWITPLKISVGITNSVGDTLWTRQYLDGSGKCLTQNYYNGYTVLGNDGNNIILIRTNELGDSLWTKTYGGSGLDNGEFFTKTPDGGYIIVGSTESFGTGGSDVWLIKIDSLGNTQWTKTIGGAEDDYGKYVQVTSDGGYIVTGSTYSYGQGESDVWVIKLAPDPLLNIEVNNDIVISDYKLAQNFPNPFNPITTIKYQIPEMSFVTLKVYDVLGSEIAILVNEIKAVGSYKLEFNASKLPSGVYFYSLKAGNFVETKKMVLIK